MDYQIAPLQAYIVDNRLVTLPERGTAVSGGGSLSAEYPYCIETNKVGKGSSKYICFRTADEASRKEGQFIKADTLPPGSIEYPYLGDPSTNKFKPEVNEEATS